MNLFDIMKEAQGGDAFATLARQYGLSEDQVQSAVQAIICSDETCGRPRHS